MNSLRIAAKCATKRLQGTFDAQSLFVKLSGQMPSFPPLYFQRTNGLGLIVTSAALKFRCSGTEVRVTALNPGATRLIDALQNRLRTHFVRRADDELTLDFPRCEDAAEEVRLIAPTPYTSLRTILSILKSDSAAEPFGICLMGVIGFDHIDMFEALPERPATGIEFPDFDFWLADGLIVIEPEGSARLLALAVGCADTEQAHVQHCLALERLSQMEQNCLAASTPMNDREAAVASEPDDIQLEMSDGEFEELVTKLKQHIAAGDIFQVVPSRDFCRPCLDPLAAFDHLGLSDPSAYRFFLQSEWGVLFGASPEPAARLAKGVNGLRLQVCPIAGTRPRGKSADHDDRLEAELSLDGKEIAEHLMLVDLARNDVARVSHTASRRVTRLLEVQKFASVMHLVSVVEGDLAIGLDAFDALRACMNVGTLSGAPKLRAIELLREYELSARGPYGGAVAWINGDGEMDSAVVIRSALVADGVAHVRAGAGVVYDSIPELEAAETRHKASAVLRSIAESRT